MDIQDFYDGNPKRRDGQDISYGDSWSLAGDQHHLWDVFYNDASCEIYLMRKPVVNPLVGWTGYAISEDIRDLERIAHRIVGIAEHLIHPGQIRAKTGEVAVWHRKDLLTEQLTVEILGTFASESEVDGVLDGWRSAVSRPDSQSWLRARVSRGAAQD